MAPHPPQFPHPEDIRLRVGAGPAPTQDALSFKNSFESHSAVQLLIDSATGLIVDANDAAARFYGWSRMQLRQMRIQDLDAPNPEEPQQTTDKAQARPASHFDVRHRRADGSVRDIRIFTGTTAPDGRGLRHFIVFDVTTLRWMENRLRQAQNMEILGRLAETSAHDIKNMLQVILASAEIAQMKLAPTSPVHVELAEILTAVRRSTELARHLLTSARQQSRALQSLEQNDTAK